mmetsp:Transcript_4654/g.15394  ORF Transcript_4654/g.15394 Transcript_4654/m.15394 type:complete len:462 (-) Transcript_4654:2128-3513(-)
MAVRVANEHCGVGGVSDDARRGRRRGVRVRGGLGAVDEGPRAAGDGELVRGAPLRAEGDLDRLEAARRELALGLFEPDLPPPVETAEIPRVPARHRETQRVAQVSAGLVVEREGPLRLVPDHHGVEVDLCRLHGDSPESPLARHAHHHPAGLLRPLGPPPPAHRLDTAGDPRVVFPLLLRQEAPCDGGRLVPAQEPGVGFDEERRGHFGRQVPLEGEGDASGVFDGGGADGGRAYARRLEEQVPAVLQHHAREEPGALQVELERIGRGVVEHAHEPLAVRAALRRREFECHEGELVRAHHALGGPALKGTVGLQDPAVEAPLGKLEFDRSVPVVDQRHCLVGGVALVTRREGELFGGELGLGHEFLGVLDKGIAARLYREHPGRAEGLFRHQAEVAHGFDVRHALEQPAVVLVVVLWAEPDAEFLAPPRGQVGALGECGECPAAGLARLGRIAGSGHDPAA